MNFTKSSSLLPTRRNDVPCLGVSPALKDVCAYGWRDLTLLLLQAEERERRLLKREENYLRGSIINEAQERVHFQQALVGREGEKEENHSDKKSREVRDRCQIKPPGLSPAQLPEKAAEQSYASLSSSSRPNKHNTAASVSKTPSLTPFQRFCFTKSTASKLCQALWSRSTPQQQRKLHTQSRKPNAAASNGHLHGNKNSTVTTFSLPTTHHYVEENFYAAAIPSPRAGPTTFAVVSSARRDEWSWSHTRARDTWAPTEVPTLARTYGSAQRRAASIELIFDRLSYEGKALVARQAESLGLLTNAPPLFVQKSERTERGQEQQVPQYRSASFSTPEVRHTVGVNAATSTPVKDVDATVLDCVSNETQTATESYATHLIAAAAAGQLSPAPIAPL